MSAAEIVAGGLLAVGVFFVIVGAIGFVRLPDVFCRLHVTGVLDTMGAPGVILAIVVYAGLSVTSVKLLLAAAFLIVTSPLVGHLLARAALEAGHQPGVIANLDEAQDPLRRRRRSRVA